MLSIEHVYFNYGKVPTLEDVSIEIKDGQSICVIGANGAGKSTLAKVISGILKPASGKILVDNVDVAGKQAHAMVNKGIALVPEGRQLFVRQPVKVNLELGAYHLKGAKRKEMKQDLEYIYNIFPRLKERQDQIAGLLSGGEQQMLAIGRALMAKPQLLILDEPSMGLSPILVEEIVSIILKLKEQGTSILLIEQNANMALDITEFGYVMESGKIILTGASDELVHNPMVQHAYLGEANSDDQKHEQVHADKQRMLPSWLRLKK
jgi:branched-chain amino acid transport system ATP-binding protein